MESIDKMLADLGGRPKEYIESEKVAKLRSILSKKRNEIGQIKASKITQAFIEEIEKNYEHKDLVKTKLYHLLNYSTTDDIISPETDLPYGEFEDLIVNKL